MFKNLLEDLFKRYRIEINKELELSGLNGFETQKKTIKVFHDVYFFIEI
jgi:hypothetical protein